MDHNIGKQFITATVEVVVAFHINPAMLMSGNQHICDINVYVLKHPPDHTIEPYIVYCVQKYSDRCRHVRPCNSLRGWSVPDPAADWHTRVIVTAVVL